jgi:hypothetical protein
MVLDHSWEVRRVRAGAGEVVAGEVEDDDQRRPELGNMQMQMERVQGGARDWGTMSLRWGWAMFM